MRNLLAAVLTAALALCGCSSSEVALGPEFRPLVRVERSSLRPDGVFWTLGDTVYTRDLASLDAEDDVSRTALLLHERQHAIHQLAYPTGIAGFATFYATNASFMIGEEKDAWRVQIFYLVAHGEASTVDPDYIAKFMSETYVCLGRQTIGYDEARKWVIATVAEAPR